MKTKIMLILALSFFGIVSCNSQETKPVKKATSENKPLEEYSVNRKYDEQGNLIEFDSIYTSYYSNIQGDTLALDSIMKNFEIYFNDHFSPVTSDNILDLDSTFNDNFFSNDYFEKQFFNQDGLMLDMMRDMDSIKNEFFRIHSRNLQKNN
jgi:hypothetical protein